MHDGPGDDHRHAPDGSIAGRGRRAERAHRTGSYWGPAVRNGRNAVYRAGDVFADEQAGSGELGEALGRRDRRSTPMSANGATHDEAHGRQMLWILIAVVVLALALLLGWLPHYKRNKEVNATAQQQKNALPIVEVQTVHIASSEQELTLPGTVTPLRSAHIYARASGYLKVRYVDLGDTVRKGQLLGIISAPDLDASVAQQAAAVQQSKDNVLTAQSTLRLQQATYARVHTLVLHGILSQQDDDAARAAAESAQSSLQAMENAVKGAQEALARVQALA